MPLANVRGVNINYKILGDDGPWVTLSPGGRRDLSGVEPLAARLADHGYRVLIHDRRNCGASDVVIEGDDSEYEIWADDLHVLLSQLGGIPAFVHRVHNAVDAFGRVAGFELTPLAVPHGEQEVLGFRAGPLGYITDAKRLPRPTLEALRGVRVLVLNALWFGRPHPNHFSVEEAVAAAQLVGAERTFLVHLTHRVRHAELMEALPPGIRPAYDGLVVEL
jgi:pimeloyl-ACP methyl ester carboxylesterase